MHLIYLDESGNTGNNLNDVDQPIFVLCALIVPESSWLEVERDLLAVLETYAKDRPDRFEVHATDIRSGRGFFKDWTVPNRIEFRDAWLQVAVKHHLRVVYRAIRKDYYARWLKSEFGPGIIINPHVAAFSLVSTVVDEYLRQLNPPVLGMFISDENKEIRPDVEKAIHILRGTDGKVRLGQIVEKGFFADSHHCLLLQLCDVIALSLRKREESQWDAKRAKPFDQAAFPIIKSLLHNGKEATMDVLAWLAEQQKK